MTFAAAPAGVASRKDLFTMGTVIGSEPGTTNARVSVMEGEELARKLERVFQIFCRAQEDWAMTHAPEQSAGDMEKDADCPA
jgi:hypothetical protein